MDGQTDKVIKQIFNYKKESEQKKHIINPKIQNLSTNIYFYEFCSLNNRTTDIFFLKIDAYKSEKSQPKIQTFTINSN